MLLALQLVRGFLVGVAGLLPGLCGSTLLVLFGLYRPLTVALARPFTDVRGNLRRFGPFFLAAGLGVLAGSRLLATLFARHEVPTLYLFMGFMLGVLPDLFQHARRAGRHPAGWLAFAAMFGLCLGLAALQDRLIPRDTPLQGHWGIWLAAGAGIGIGAIVPGASVAFLLIYFGVYSPLLDGVAGLDRASCSPSASAPPPPSCSSPAPPTGCSKPPKAPPPAASSASSPAPSGWSFPAGPADARGFSACCCWPSASPSPPS